MINNYDSVINPFAYTEDLSYRTTATSIYQDPVDEFANEEIIRRKFYPEFTLLFDTIDRDIETVTRSVYSLADLLAYVGGLFGSIFASFGILKLLFLNNSAEIMTWDEMRKKKDDDALDPQDTSKTSKDG